MLCFHKKVFLEQQMSEVFYTGNKRTGSYLLQQQNYWAFIFTLCLLDTYRRETFNSVAVVWTDRSLEDSLCCYDLGLCWKIFVVMKMTGNTQDQSAAIGGPHSLTSNILCEGWLCPHLEQEIRSVSWIPVLLLNWIFKNGCFYQLTGLACADFLFVLLWKYFYLQWYFHWEMPLSSE